MDTKKCTKCYEEKNTIEFPRSKSNKCGTGQPCRECGRRITAEWVKDNPEYIERNREKKRAITKEWHSSNKERIYKRTKYRYQNEPLFKLRMILRVQILRYIKNKEGKHTEEILGETFDNVRVHLERQFKEGMTWDNHGEWHIDHIIPLANGKNREELIELNHYTNLQPLWAKDNLSKGAKLDWKPE